MRKPAIAARLTRNDDNHAARARARLARRAVVPVLATAALVACSSGEPGGATVQGKDTHNLWVAVLVMALIVFFAVEAAIVWVILRYGRKPGDDELPKQVHGNTVLEVVWFLIPTVIIGSLFVVSLRTLHRVDARAVNPAVTVEVDGFQWQWNFKYPNDGFTVRGSFDKPPEMVVPLGEPVHVNEHSVDVIHSWYVPAFLFKRDVVPGQDNNFDFTPDTLGVYGGQCAEFCGLLHNKMTFSVRVVDRPTYDAWVLQQKEAEAARLAQCGAPTADVKISAQGIKFDKPCIAIAAGQSYVINFDHKDPGIGHNVAVYKDDSAKDPLFQGQIVQGPTQVTYRPPNPLVEGEYFFRCDVHPIMNGTVIVR
jgi:cytochrome c oxidase subunit 2